MIRGRFDLTPYRPGAVKFLFRKFMPPSGNQRDTQRCLRRRSNREDAFLDSPLNTAFVITGRFGNILYRASHSPSRYGPAQNHALPNPYGKPAPVPPPEISGLVLLAVIDSAGAG